MNDLKRKINEELKDVRLSKSLKERILEQAAADRSLSGQTESAGRHKSDERSETSAVETIRLEEHYGTSRWRWFLTAAVSCILVMMIPVTIFAISSLYRISVRKGEDRDGYMTVVVAQERTSSTEENTGFEPTEESTTIIWQTVIEVQENPDGSFRYFPRKEAWIEEGNQRTRIEVDMSKEDFYFLTFSYLPEGIRRNPLEPQKYETVSGDLGITPVLVILDEEQKWEFPYRGGIGVKTFEVNGHSAFAVYKENGFCEIGMLLEDQNLMLDMFVGKEISEEEIEKILAGVVVEEKPYCEEGFAEMPAIIMTYEEFVKMWGGGA